MGTVLKTYLVEDTTLPELQVLSALATVGALQATESTTSPLADQWYNTGYRKHLRRAKTGQLARVEEELSGKSYDIDGVRVWVSEISEQDDIPNMIRRQQLSGFKFDQSKFLSSAPVTVRINDDLGMSFGKAGVAAAHAGQLLVLKLAAGDSPAFDMWMQAGFKTQAEYGAIDVVNFTGATVEDYGLTEVPEGSLTAQAFIAN